MSGKPGACFRRARTWLSALSLLAAAAPACAEPTGLDAPIVVTQVPRAKRPPARPDRGSLTPTDGFDAARLLLVSPDGSVQVLSQAFYSACDPDVSFDGQRLLFAGRKLPTDHWRIWEMGLDGQGLRPVSPENLDARSPIHVSTLFTLDSPEPWFTTVFVGQEPTLNERGSASASSLYNVKLDGTELRRLTYNPNQNANPFQMWDGRVLYSAERYPNQPDGGTGRVGLYAIHLEGADMELYGAGKARRIQRMPCATDVGLVVFVESTDPSSDGSGQLACVEERRPHVTYRPLTTAPTFAYLYPSPVPGGRLLVARRLANGKGTFGVFRFDLLGGRCDPVFDTQDYDEMQAVVVATRKRPDGHSTVVDPKLDTGLFYGLNCYDADARMAPHLATGMVQRVRFIEGMPRPAPSSTAGPGPQREAFIPRRLVGEAPVEADGSFNVEVPADTPLLLQALDARGVALASCGWIWVKPNEKRGCIGCHEDPERVPENAYVLALRRPSNRLVLPPEDRRSISFRADIAPVLQQHCAATECHGGRKTDLRLPLTDRIPSETDLRKAYANLLALAKRKAGESEPVIPAGKYVDPGRARTSWLVWQLAGTSTAQPWDSDPHLRAPEVNPMPPPGKGTALSPEQLRTFIQWIDMGAPYAAPPTPSPTPPP